MRVTGTLGQAEPKALHRALADLPSGRHELHREILMNHMLTESGQDGQAPATHRRPRRRMLAIGGTADGQAPGSGFDLVSGVVVTHGAVGKTPESTTTYKVSRVTVADIAAGKF